MRMSGSVVNNVELRFDGAKRDDRRAEHSFAIPDQGTMALQSLVAPQSRARQEAGDSRPTAELPLPHGRGSARWGWRQRLTLRVGD